MNMLIMLETSFRLLRRLPNIMMRPAHRERTVCENRQYYWKRWTTRSSMRMTKSSLYLDLTGYHCIRDCIKTIWRIFADFFVVKLRLTGWRLPCLKMVTVSYGCLKSGILLLRCHNEKKYGAENGNKNRDDW